MHIIKASKRVNAGQLYDEIVAAVPELAPTPTGPDGRLVAQVLIEQVDDQHLLVHLPGDDEAGVSLLAEVDEHRIGKVIQDHKRKPEKTVDPVADAMKRVKQRADHGDDLAKDILTLLGG